jgi:hypothetical protein
MQRAAYGLYMTFVDLTKAFDTVSRTGLWKILARLGCPPKFLKMITELHENQEGQIRLNGELSNSLSPNSWNPLSPLD